MKMQAKVWRPRPSVQLAADVIQKVLMTGEPAQDLGSKIRAVENDTDDDKNHATKCMLSTPTRMRWRCRPDCLVCQHPLNFQHALAVG